MFIEAELVALCSRIDELHGAMEFTERVTQDRRPSFSANLRSILVDLESLTDEITSRIVTAEGCGCAESETRFARTRPDF